MQLNRADWVLEALTIGNRRVQVACVGRLWTLAPDDGRRAGCSVLLGRTKGKPGQAE